jgi:hypothetical protein
MWFEIATDVHEVLMRIVPVLITMALAAGVCLATEDAASVPQLAELQKKAARLAPTPIRADISRLSAGDRRALGNLIQAARLLNDVYMEQLWRGNRALYGNLQKDKSALGRARLDYFWLNKGPWDDLDGYTAFLPGVPARKPLGANFYPEDMNREEFESWLKDLPAAEQERAKGFFSVIRRGADGKLKLSPYSEAYGTELEKAEGLLREAAANTSNESLKKFLLLRADAFLSNDYYQSDLAWMDLDAPLDITIGPYETYTDELFGYKAAFEAYVNLRDDAESAKLAAFSEHLQEIENNLPEDARYRVAKLGAASPIRVVDEILASGDGAHGVQTAAYNLPNDERVVQQKGSKRVMLKNVQEAKFKTVLLPIAGRILAPEDRPLVNFDWFFTHILAHELTHGLGPHQIQVQGRTTSPREQIKELYSAIEEAKADVTGLFALQYMIEHSREMKLSSLLPNGGETAERQLYTTYLASAFRSLRFGLSEAHGKGQAVQLNYLLDKGGFQARPDGTFAVDFGKIKEAVRQLDHELLTLEAEGNYAGAKRMLDDLGVIRPEVQKALDRLGDIPTDIAPQFVTAAQVAPEHAAASIHRRK